MDFTVLGIDLEQFMAYAPYALMGVVGVNAVLSFVALLIPKSPLLRVLKAVSTFLWIVILVGVWFFATEMFQQVNDSLPPEDE